MYVTTTFTFEGYRVTELFAGVRTPALLIDPDRVTANVHAIVAQLGGDARRWRPHVKTAKVGSVMQMMCDAGLTRFKCATTLELKALLDIGARDVLVSFPTSVRTPRESANSPQRIRRAHHRAHRD